MGRLQALVLVACDALWWARRRPSGGTERRVPGTRVGVSVEVEGRRAPLYPAPDTGRFYLEARAGARYAVVLTNRTRRARSGSCSPSTASTRSAASGTRAAAACTCSAPGSRPRCGAGARPCRRAPVHVRGRAHLLRGARREGQRPHGLDRGRGVSRAACAGRAGLRSRSPGAVIDRWIARWSRKPARTLDDEGRASRRDRNGSGRRGTPGVESPRPRATATTRPSREAPISTGPRRRALRQVLPGHRLGRPCLRPGHGRRVPRGASRGRASHPSLRVRGQRCGPWESCRARIPAATGSASVSAATSASPGRRPGRGPHATASRDNLRPPVLGAEVPCSRRSPAS